MSDYIYRAPTNDRSGSQYDVLGHLMPARVFVLVVVDEPGKDGFLVRRSYTTIHDPYLQALRLRPLDAMREVHPEKYGLWPRGPGSSASIAEHVMGYDKLTSYISTSSDFPSGADRFKGKVIFVDIAKAKRAGAKLVTTQEIKLELDRYAAQYPHLKNRIARIKSYAEGLDKEVLVKPNPMVPPSGIYTERGLAVTLGLVKFARVVQVVGIVFTAYDLGVATNESFEAKSVKPIEKEVIRQMGGWGGAIAGWKMGAAAGALVGLETGPGAVITGLVGGVVFGSIGYFGGGFAADEIVGK
ncbi:glycine zipper family protein [Burkholderia ubonensis]|uniref:glycine zipper family protein n=1 Tax=Burkholderia ubonensis TaxID=101571 RepID=UPI00358DFBCC